MRLVWDFHAASRRQGARSMANTLEQQACGKGRQLSPGIACARGNLYPSRLQRRPETDRPDHGGVCAEGSAARREGPGSEEGGTDGRTMQKSSRPWPDGPRHTRRIRWGGPGQYCDHGSDRRRSPWREASPSRSHAMPLIGHGSHRRFWQRGTEAEVPARSWQVANTSVPSPSPS